MKTGKTTDRRKFLTGMAGLAALTGLTSPPLRAGRMEGEDFQGRMIDRYPAFDDARSREVVFLAHCIINQNARCNGSGNFAASVPLIPEYLLENRVGIAQIPCPELGCLGLGREGLIYDQLSTPAARRYLNGLARDIVYQIGQYGKHGFTVHAVLGVDCSPSCGVNCHAYNGARPGKGAFMEELSLELGREGLELPLIGVADDSPREALEKLAAIRN